MPLTPFHMGAAMVLKPVLGPRFSVLVFGVSQVAIDVEPLVRIIRGDTVLHGWTHTLSGAFVIGVGSALLAYLPVNWWIRLLRRKEHAPPTGRFLSWPVAFASAWIGTGSHLLLDGVMHADMHPFAPLTDANPLLGAIGLPALHLGLVAAGVFGLAALAIIDETAARRAG